MFSDLIYQKVSMSDTHHGLRSQPVSAIVIHYTASVVRKADDVVAYWEQSNPHTSATYIIDQAGGLTGVIPEEWRPYTTGSYGLGARDIDDRAITVECSCDEITPDGYTISLPTMIKLVRLMVDIGQRYKITWNWTGDESGNVHVHRWYQSTPCPGDYLFARIPEITNLANAIIDKWTISHIVHRQTEPKYNKVEDLPEWARSDIQYLIDNEYLLGTDNGLQLSLDSVRILTIMSRIARQMDEDFDRRLHESLKN